MLIGLFMLGSVGFWLLLSVACLVLIAAVENEKNVLATITLVLTFAALGLLGDFNVLQALAAHPSEAITLLVTYFAAGTVWAVVKWWFFIRSARELYEDGKRAWLFNQYLLVPNPDYNPKSNRAFENREYIEEPYTANNKIPVTGRVTIPDQLKEKFSKYAVGTLIPTVARNKGRILSWMTWWPYSLAWTLIDDPVRRAFKEIYNRVKGVFIRIRNRAFGDISADLHADTTLD